MHSLAGPIKLTNKTVLVSPAARLSGRQTVQVVSLRLFPPLQFTFCVVPRHGPVFRALFDKSPIRKGGDAIDSI
jgi:hypothetical protein